MYIVYLLKYSSNNKLNSVRTMRQFYNKYRPLTPRARCWLEQRKQNSQDNDGKQLFIKAWRGCVGKLQIFKTSDFQLLWLQLAFLIFVIKSQWNFINNLYIFYLYFRSTKNEFRTKISCMHVIIGRFFKAFLIEKLFTMLEYFTKMLQLTTDIFH